MKFLLLISICFCFHYVKAQDSKALLQEVVNNIEKEDYVKGIHVAERYVQVISKESGDESRAYLDAIYKLGLTYSGAKEFEKAKTTLDKYLNLSLKLNGETNPNYARALTNVGTFYSLHEKDAEAIPYYLKSLNITERNSADSGKDYSGTLRSLAVSYKSLGDFSKAEKEFKASAEKRKNIFGEMSWEYEEVLLDLADLYYETNQFQTALPVVESAEKIIKKLAGISSLDYIFHLNFIGDIYFKLSDFKNAEKNYLEAIRLYKEKFSLTHSNYAEFLYNLAKVYAATKKQDEAERLYKQAMTIYKSVPNAENRYLTALNSVGNFYIDYRRYSEARSLFQEGTLLAKKLYGAESTDYDHFLINLAYTTDYLNDYTKSEKLYQELLPLRKKLYGEKSLKYSLAANNGGLVFMELKNFPEAEKLFKEAIEIRKVLNGTDHVDYWQSVSNLANSYKNEGRTEESEKLYLQAHEWYLRNGQKYQNLVALSFHRLAVLYTDMPGRRKDAEKYFLEALPRLKDQFGEANTMYIDDLAILGNVYKVTGEYEKAEALYREAIRVLLSKKNEKPEYYAKAMNLMGRFYKENGIYNKADSFFKAATNYTREAFTNNSVKYADALISQANFYTTAGRYSAAEPMLLEAESMINKIDGKNNLSYLTVLLNLALVYQKLSQWEKSFDMASKALSLGNSFGLTDADLFLEVIVPYRIYLNEFFEVEQMYKSAILTMEKRTDQQNERYIKLQNDLTDVYFKFRFYDKVESLINKILPEAEKILKPTHHEYARLINNQALLYLQLKKYDKAEEAGLKSLELRKGSLGVNHPDYITSLKLLASVYFETNQLKKGIEKIIDADNLIQDNLLRNFSVLAEAEKTKAIDEVLVLHEIMNRAGLEFPEANLLEQNLNTVLLVKSLALATTLSVLKDLRSSSDKQVLGLLNEWQDTKTFLGQQYAIQKDRRVKNIDSIEKKAEALEKELTRISAAFSKANVKTKIHFSDLQKRMKPDEAIIEFVKFPGMDPATEQYAAYILRKTDAVPKYVRLCKEDDLKKLFVTGASTSVAIANNFYRGIGSEENFTVSKGDSLYKLIWQPLDSFLSGIKTISYSPAGKLYTIALQALPADNDKILMDKYVLQQYSSTRLIAERLDKADAKPKDACLFGDAQFTMNPSEMKTANPIKEFASNYVPANRGGSNALWSNLPGTAAEINKIKQLFTANGISTKSFTGGQSTESALKNLSGRSPEVLHIATHGFFLSDSTKHTDATGNVYSMSQDPLFRSGLVLASANYAWSGNTPVEGAEDGIATAYEISQLDLSKTQLVVLSACETALGDVKGSEGVFGLQRAFKMAGVKKMIVSLWQVPDKETAELMTTFYSYWMKGKSINDAFAQAQADMRIKYSPFYWAAFVLIE